MDNSLQNSHLIEQGKPQIESIEFLDTKLWNNLLKSLNDTKLFKAEVGHNRVLVQDYGVQDTQWGTQYSHLGRSRFSVKQNPIVTFARYILSVWAV